MSKEWLVNKLRKLAPICRGQAEIYIEKSADEIERLLAENAELRKDAERQWVGLTEEEATELWERIDDRDSWELLVQVQAKLREKNT